MDELQRDKTIESLSHNPKLKTKVASLTPYLAEI